MIGLGTNNEVVVSTVELSSYDYSLKAMVRLVGLAMHAPDLSSDDRELIRQACYLLEDMLPGEGQINPTPNPTPTLPKGGSLAG